MNFQQLRIVRETVRQNFNLTEVAEVLYTSQPGVSKHIKDLEDELGVELFVRKGKRFIGLTEPGKELIGIVERLLLDAQNIKKLADQFTQRDEGELVVATTHTQARYALPKVVKSFKEEFPRVHLVLHQGSPAEIASMLKCGEADIGIATEALDGAEDVVTFPYYQWHHAVIVPEGHPLQTAEKLALNQIAEYPIITYHKGYTGRSQLDKTFADAGVTPDIVMSALDADVIKSYVELGLGIGIVASMAYFAERDQGLRMPKSKHLFRLNTTLIGVRKGSFLRGFAYRFMELCSADLTEAHVKSMASLAGQDMRSIPSGYAGLKSRTRLDALSITRDDCQSLNKLLNSFVPLPNGWLPPMAYRAFSPAVSRAIRLEALKPHIPELAENHSLLQTCVQVSGSIRFYGDLPLEQEIRREYKTELLSDRLCRRSKQIRLVQMTRYISDGLCLVDERIELHYRIKPSQSSPSLVERNYHAEMIDQLMVVDDISLASYVALGFTYEPASVDLVHVREVLQGPGVLVPIDLVVMILMSALHLAMPDISVKSLEYHTYSQLYTGDSLRICASLLPDQQVLLWVECSGHLVFRGVVTLVTSG